MNKHIMNLNFTSIFEVAQFVVILLLQYDTIVNPSTIKCTATESYRILPNWVRFYTVYRGMAPEPNPT